MLKHAQRQLALTLRRHPLLPFLFLATLMVDLVLGANQRWDQIYTVSIAIAQAGLLGSWAGQLRRGWIARVIIAAVVLFLICAILAWDGPSDKWIRLVSILSFYGLAIAVVTALCRVLGRAIKHLQGREHDTIRWSIGGIFATTTFAAIVAALSRLADFPNRMLEISVVLGCWGLLVLVAVEINRRVSRSSLFVIAIMLFSFTCGILILFTASGQQYGSVFFYGTICQGVLYSVWLIGLRFRGKRVRRQKPATATAPPLEIYQEPSEDAPQSIDLEG